VPLIYLSSAWVAGILLGAKFTLPPALILIGLIPLPLLFFFRQHRKTIILVSLCLIALFGGAFRFQSSQPTVNENCLQFYNGQEIVAIKGMVSADPEVGDKTSQLRLSATEIKLEQEWQDVSGTALLFVPRYPTYNYGDVLLVTGRLETPPQLNDFDYKGYLAHQGIYSTVSYPEIEVLETGRGFKPLAWVYSARDHLSQSLAKVLHEPQASLAQAIVLGIRGNISSSVNADFTRTGTAHLLAISGLHLSILAGILLSAGIWLFGRRRYLYIWLALGTIWLYAIITGMHPPVIRGATMASLFLTAELLGRQRSAITSLAFAAAIMVGISPQILWSASFQMSFMAMAGLILVTPFFQAMGRKAVNATLGEDRPAVPVANTITDSFSVSLGAVIGVWPLVAYYFGIISFVGPPATFLTLPALPGIITTGALAGSLGLVARPVAQIIGWLAWLPLSYLRLVVKALATIPLAFLKVTYLNPNIVWAYYLTLGVALWLNSHRRQAGTLTTRPLTLARSGTNKMTDLVSKLPRKWGIPPLLTAAILVSVAAATMPDNNLHVSFLDVGQGDAILIHKGNQQVLVDGGPSPQSITLELGKKMPFWDRTIELVVLTHPHPDHVTGLVEVLNRYKVKQVLYPDLDSDSSTYKEWLRLVDEKDIKYTIAQAGQEIDLGDGVVIEVLNPQTPLLSDTESDIDNNGVVLRISMEEVSFLLTADIQQEAEFELITRRASLNSTVLKVAHHGSDTSTTPEFLAVVNPGVAVISVGKDNPYGHPGDEVIARLEENVSSENIYRTDENSTIEFITDGERLWVRTEK
jgi:competence protein ComEC